MWFKFTSSPVTYKHKKMSSQSPVWPFSQPFLYFTLMGREAMYDMLPNLLSTKACRGRDRREEDKSEQQEDRRRGVGGQTPFIPRRPAGASSAPLRRFVDLGGGEGRTMKNKSFGDDGYWLITRQENSILLVRSSQTWTEPPSTTSLETCRWIILEAQHQQQSVRDTRSTVVMTSIFDSLRSHV